MKVKLTHYERAAGIFVLVALGAALISMFGVALKQGWFERKVDFLVKLESADGIHQGTVVQMAGLRVGSVRQVELRGAREVLATLRVSESYAKKVRRDSVVRVSRPFIIGEKVFDITPGTAESEAMLEMEYLPAEVVPDLLDLASGRTMAPYLSSMSRIADNLRILADAFSDTKRMRSIVTMFDEMGPLVKSAGVATKEAGTLLKGINKNEKFTRTIENLNALVEELNKAVPDFLRDSPQLGKDMHKIAHNLAILTDEFQKTLPALAEIGPKLPKASQRAIEALDETVVTLKALQKSFLLRGNVREVREEENASKKEQDNRSPAQQ